MVYTLDRSAYLLVPHIVVVSFSLLAFIHAFVHNITASAVISGFWSSAKTPYPAIPEPRHIQTAFLSILP